MTLGPVVEGLRVVQTGLAAGDRIVLKGLQRVRPGAKVTAERGRDGGIRSAVGAPAPAASAHVRRSEQ